MLDWLFNPFVLGLLAFLLAGVIVPHNLWPLEIVMVSGGSVCAIGALTVVRRILRVDP